MRSRLPLLELPAALVLVAAAAAPAPAQITSLQSITSSGTPSDRPSTAWGLSSDARYLAFSSATKKLVPGTLATREHCFVKDRLTGVIENDSVDSAGIEANADVTDIRISRDGRFVVFASRATNLVAGDANAHEDCFLRDREAGTTERVSLGPDGEEGDGDSFKPIVSTDGRFVVFTSAATNFTPFDDNGALDVFVRDRFEATTRLVSAMPNDYPGQGVSIGDDLTPDGHYAIFQSSTTGLVDTWYDDTQMFMRDLQEETTEIVSLGWDGVPPRADCHDGRCTADGVEVFFTSRSQDLVPNDGNAANDVFVRNRLLETTERVNVGSDGEEANGDSDYPSVSDDGQFVGFSTGAAFDPADTNDASDAYVRDRLRGLTFRVSVGSDGRQSAFGSGDPFVSGDGHAFFFLSGGDELDPIDVNGVADVFLNEHAPARATSRHYGAGFPGALGVPACDVEADPVLGQPLDFVFTNSSGIWTIGFLLIGNGELSVHGSWGGDLLVSLVTFLPVPLPPVGYTLRGAVPFDASLWGTSVWLQTIEVDPSAAKGLSSTDGLELDFGS